MSNSTNIAANAAAIQPTAITEASKAPKKGLRLWTNAAYTINKEGVVSEQTKVATAIIRIFYVLFFPISLLAEAFAACGKRLSLKDKLQAQAATSNEAPAPALKAEAEAETAPRRPKIILLTRPTTRRHSAPSSPRGEGKKSVSHKRSRSLDLSAQEDFDQAASSAQLRRKPAGATINKNSKGETAPALPPVIDFKARDAQRAAASATGAPQMTKDEASTVIQAAARAKLTRDDLASRGRSLSADKPVERKIIHRRAVSDPVLIQSVLSQAELIRKTQARISTSEVEQKAIISKAKQLIDEFRPQEGKKTKITKTKVRRLGKSLVTFSTTFAENLQKEAETTHTMVQALYDSYATAYREITKEREAAKKARPSAAKEPVATQGGSSVNTDAQADLAAKVRAQLEKKAASSETRAQKTHREVRNWFKQAANTVFFRGKKHFKLKKAPGTK